MKQEYIIYDWVMLNGMKACVRESYTDADDSFVYIVNDEEYKAKDLKGIPLTPEILEKNGWKKSNYYGNDYTKGEFHFDGANFLYIGDYDYPLVDSPIEYVHELQHVFFGLNLYTGMSV